MIAIIIGILIFAIEAFLVRTGLQLDLCTQDTINGPGAFMLITLVYLAVLLIICGAINVALKVFKLDRALWIVLTTFVIFGAMGLAFWVGSLLNMQDCGLTGY